MKVPSVGWSKFATDRHVLGTGFSYSTFSNPSIADLVRQNWHKRVPGHGETTLDRKIVVPIQPFLMGSEGDIPMFFIPEVALRSGLPLKAIVTSRQQGEDLFVETYIDFEDAKELGINPEPATKVEVVCYCAEVLLENGGVRTTNDDWEIVSLNASNDDKEPPMDSLTMARNFLEMPGGTKSDYTAEEFAKAVYYKATNRKIKIKKTPVTKPIKEELADIRRQIKHLHWREIDLKENCKHELRMLTEGELADDFMSVSANCMKCGKSVGSWRCKESPDSVCHTIDDVVILPNVPIAVQLIDGSLTYPSSLNVGKFNPDDHNVEACVFCGEPGERK